MDFLFNEDQIAIRDLANQIFTDRATDEFMLEFSRSKLTYDDTLWSTLAEQGLLGICIPEAFGGTGLGFIELCSILEEQGRRVAPVPLFSSLVLAALPITHFGSDEQKQRWLTPLAAGDIKLTASIADMGATEAYQHTVSVKDDVLNGIKTAVLDGAVAAAVLVAADDNSIYIVDTSSEGVSVQAETSFSGENFATISFSNVKADLLGAAGQGKEILSWLEQHADVALAAQQMGVCDEALRRTAAYTTERKQFGAPLGSFQAVAMRAADAYVDCEALRSAYWGAMWRVSEGLEAEAEVRTAKYWACQGSHRIVHAAQHLHGGMGSDIEFPIHRYFIMSKQIAFLSGNASVQLAKLGQLLASNDKVGLTSLAV